MAQSKAIRFSLAIAFLVGFFAGHDRSVFGGLSNQSLSDQGLSNQGLSNQGLSNQGLSNQGLSNQGLSNQGLSNQGLSNQGLSNQGVATQGLSNQGLSNQGLSNQGLSNQGLSNQGLSNQGLSNQGLSNQGTRGIDRVRGFLAEQVFLGIARADVAFPNANLQGLQTGSYINFVPVPDPMTGIRLQRGPTDSRSGTFIFVPGMPATTEALKGSFWNMILTDQCSGPAHCPASATCTDGACIDACSSDAECPAPGAKCVLGSCSDIGGGIPLYIADVEIDRQANSSNDPFNEDVYLYTVYYRQPGTGQWSSLCPVDGEGKARAMAIPLDPTNWSGGASPAKLAFACTASGVAAKCARTWGYKPWRSAEPNLLYNTCLVAARAAYCQDGNSFTRNGTLVDLFDQSPAGSGIGVVNATVGFSVNPFDKKPMLHDEYHILLNGRVRDVFAPSETQAIKQSVPLIDELHLSGLQASRYPDLDPGRSCAAAPYVIGRCDPAVPFSCRRADDRAPFPFGQLVAVNSSFHCDHVENEPGEPMNPSCSTCTSRICAIDPTCCGDAGANPFPTSLVWDKRCTDLRDQMCRTTPVGAATENVWPLGVRAEGHVGQPVGTLNGAIGAFDGVVTEGGIQYVEGWACDPDFPSASSPIQISVGAPLGTEGSQLFTATADAPLVPGWRDIVSAECGGGDRHGFHVALPPEAAGQVVFVYGIDLNLPGAPFSLLRGGRKIASVPGGQALPRPRAAIFTGWVEPELSGEYLFNVDVGPNDKFRLWVNGMYVAGNWKDLVTTPPTPGAFTLDPPPQPPLQYLQKGVRYGVRLEYLRPDTLVNTGTSRLAVTWSRPTGESPMGPSPIPPTALYAMGQPDGNGLQGTYFPGVTSLASLPVDNTGSRPERTFGAVDHVWSDRDPPIVGKDKDPITGLSVADSFGARFEGQFVPPISGVYTFSADTDGAARITVNGAVVATVNQRPGILEENCAHDICATGVGMSDFCEQNNFCAADVCFFDAACCERTWDARCVQEVESFCVQKDYCTVAAPAPPTLIAGWKYNIRVEYQHDGSAPSEPVRAAKLKLMWSLAGSPREVMPAGRLLASTAADAAKQGTGLNAVYFTDAGFRSEYLDKVEPSIAFQAASPPVSTRANSMICGGIGAPACPSTSAPGAPALNAAVMVAASGEDAMHVMVTGFGAVPNAALTLYERTPPTAAEPQGTLIALGAFLLTTSDGGKFSTPLVALSRRTYVLQATQTAGGQTSALSENLVVRVTDPDAPVAPTTNPPVVTPVPGGGTVTVTGTAAPGAVATVTARVQGQTADFKQVAFVANGSGGWTAPMTLPPGNYDLFITQTSNNHTSDPGGNVVNVKVPLPVLTVTEPADNLTFTCPTRTCTVTVSGSGASTALGPVIVADGDMRFFVDLPTVPPAIVPGAGGTFTGQVALDQGVHFLKVFQRARGLDGESNAKRVIVRPPSSAIAVASPANGAVINARVIVEGTAPARQGFRGAITVYQVPRGVDTCPTSPTSGTKLADSVPLADDGRFSLSVLVSGVGRQCLAVSHTQSSLSGGGGVESEFSPSITVRVRPGAPKITKPARTGTLQFDDLRVAVEGTALVGATVTIYAEGPLAASFPNIPVTSTGTFATTVTLPAVGTYRLTATAAIDGAESGRSEPPLVIAVGDVIPPTVKVSDPADPAKKPVREIPVTATSDTGVAFNFAPWLTAVDPSVNGGPGTQLPANQIACQPSSGSVFALGATPVTCTATDGVGNRGSATFLVVARKTETPVLTGSNLTAQAQSSAGAPVNYTITATGFIADCAPAGSSTPQNCSAWRPAATGLAVSTTTLAMDRATGHFYTAVPGTIDILLRSTNGGGTWQELPSPGLMTLSQIVVRSGSPATLTLVSDHPSQTGLRISRDGGQSWITSLPGIRILGVAQDPSDEAHMLAWNRRTATVPSAVYETRDSGATWEASAGLPDVAIIAAAMDGDRVYLSLAGGNQDDGDRLVRILRRTARNAEWKERPIFPFDSIFMNEATTIHIAPSPGPCNTGDPFPTVFAGPVYSCDGGDTWQEIDFLAGQPISPFVGAGFISMAFDRPPSGKIYAYAKVRFSTELVTSSDHGKTWAAVRALDTLQLGGAPRLLLDPSATSLYASDAFRGVVRSQDGGVTWTALPTGLPLSSPRIADAAADPADPTIAYVALGDAGVYKTTNGGETWAASNGLMHFVDRGFTADKVVVHPLARDVVFAGGTLGAQPDPSPVPVVGLSWAMTPDLGTTWANLEDSAGNLFYNLGLAADPLVAGGWLAFPSQEFQVGSTLRWPTNGGNHPFNSSQEGIFRLQMVPDTNRTVVASLISFTAGGRTALFSFRDMLNGASPPTSVDTGLGGPANVVYDASDGVQKLFVGGKALAAAGGDANLLYWARVEDLLLGGTQQQQQQKWFALNGDGVFPSYQVNADPLTRQDPFATLLIDPVSGGQTMYTLGSGNTLWASTDGGKSWRRDDTVSGFVTGAWLSPVDGAIYATVSSTFADTDDYFSRGEAAARPVVGAPGVLWKRVRGTGVFPGTRIVRGDLRPTCQGPPGFPGSVTPGSTFPIGDTVLTCSATDVFGTVGTRSFTVSVASADATPPTVAITAPANGAFITGTVAYTATASDNVGVTRVELRNDGAVIATLTSSPYTFNWNTLSVSTGTHTLTARAFDAAGNSTTSASRTVTIDRTAPTVALSAPASGAIVSGTVTVSATASDNRGVARVQFYRDGTVLLGTDTTTPYSMLWNTTTTPAGSHTLTARAFDLAGNATTSAARTVTVRDITAPTVTMTSPANNALVTVGATITMAATAADATGVTRVEFTVNNVLTCTDQFAPYTCAWRVPSGTGRIYTLVARAYDAASNTRTSTVTVTSR